MKPLSFAVLLAAVAAGGAQAADQTMEHVEVIGHPVPNVAMQAAENETHAAQLLKQHRLDLLNIVKMTLSRQLEAVRRERVTASDQTVAQEAAAQQQEQMAPANTETAPVNLQQPLKLEQKAGEIRPVQESAGKQAPQEPS